MDGPLRRKRTMKLVNAAFIALLAITAVTCAANFLWLTDIVRRSVRSATLARHLVDGYRRLEIDQLEQPLDPGTVAERHAALAQQSDALAAHVAATTRHLTQAMASVAVASFGTIVAGASLMWLVTRRIARPLALLLDATERVAAGELSCRVDYEACDEMGSLARAFDRMVRYLQRSLNEIGRQRRSADERIEAATSALRTVSLTDELTGLPNLRHLREAFREVARDGSALLLVLTGIDEFTSFNARFGYEAGNLVLLALARIVRSAARDADFVARGTGAQFLVLMPGLERLPPAFVRQVQADLGSIQKLVLRRTQRDVGVTVSVGQARFPREGATLDELITVAHRRLARSREPSQAEPPAHEPAAATGKERV